MPKLALKNAAPREISYAYSAQSRAGRAVIRGLENITGRPRLIKMALGYEDEVSQGRDFWEVMTERYGVQLDAGPAGLEAIPAEGPLVIVANHPFGILDGMAMGRMLSARRDDFRIIANTVFHKAEELRKIILPVDFAETRAAQKINLATRKEALRYLADGGAIGIFPGGTVSTSKRPLGHPMDPAWRTFTSKLVTKSDATVLPIFFHGSNSRLFQLASRVHPSLRMGLLINEFGRGIKRPLKATIGAPMPRNEIKAHSRDPRELMDYLRDQTYLLSPEPLASLDYGFEFEEQHSGRERRAA
ncbi:MAG: lysophospholipid acyltransferase family protein [Pseudomonadota bacterium]